MLDFLAALLAFAAHLAVGLGLSGLFLLAYCVSTPHRELDLIRNGNSAAAIGLMGGMIGYVIVVARAISSSQGVIDTALWGLIGLGIQVAGHWALSRYLPRLYDAIEEGDVAAGIMKAGVAICLGLLNAASMTP